MNPHPPTPSPQPQNKYQVHGNDVGPHSETWKANQVPIKCTQLKNGLPTRKVVLLLIRLTHKDNIFQIANENQQMSLSGRIDLDA